MKAGSKTIELINQIKSKRLKTFFLHAYWHFKFLVDKFHSYGTRKKRRSETIILFSRSKEERKKNVTVQTFLVDVAMLNDLLKGARAHTSNAVETINKKYEEVKGAHSKFKYRVFKVRAQPFELDYFHLFNKKPLQSQWQKLTRFHKKKIFKFR